MDKEENETVMKNRECKGQWDKGRRESKKEEIGMEGEMEHGIKNGKRMEEEGEWMEGWERRDKEGVISARGKKVRE